MIPEPPEPPVQRCPKCGGRMAEYELGSTCVRCFYSMRKVKPVEPPPPSNLALYEDMMDWLRDQFEVCLLAPCQVDGRESTAMVCKFDSTTIEAIQTPVDIATKVLGINTRWGSIIKVVMDVMDDPSNPLRAESFVNPADREQRQEFLRLSTQPRLPLVLVNQENEVQRVVWQDIAGDKYRARYTMDNVEASNRGPIDFDFERAKESVQRSEARGEIP